jgi:GntR family carbon starvation induced transcriptional regulator
MRPVALAEQNGIPLMNNRLVYERLHGDILSARLLPGAKLNIAALAAALGVSAGAVREALAMLEADSLVVSAPQRGWRVSKVSEEDLTQLVQARIEIEKLCLAEAIRHGDLAWEGALVAAFHQLTRLHELESGAIGQLSAEWTLAHAQFHHAMIQGCPNLWLRRMHDLLYQQSERYRQLSAPFSATQRDVQAEHKALIDAMLERDVERAQQLIARHLEKTASLLLDSPLLAARAR